MDRTALSLGKRRGHTTGTMPRHVQGQTQYDKAHQQYGKAELGETDELQDRQTDQPDLSHSLREKPGGKIQVRSQ